MVEKYKVEQIKDFHLEHIFDCGQCFRWNRQEDGSYTGVAMGRVVNFRLEPLEPESEGKREAALIAENCTEPEFEEIWRPYLDLDRDYGQIKISLSEKDGAMAKACAFGNGIRILKQDLWETIVSFIISQNNNIPRIKGCIESLAAEFGRYAGTFRGKDYYSLPAPEVLAGLTREELAPCRLGYRAPYLIQTARQVMEMGGADELACQLAGAEDPAGKLMELSGIGPKVAACIALFGAGRHDTFPIDVWMRRVMHKMYNIDEKDFAGMERYAKEHFAPYGGFAQQYLFYYMRELGGKG
ncbi:MAG: 8-oxoguanine DNA glycosylase [Firmicutes bacterium]|nr:8-oxoguanine DNA glycosylase [Bacillota bacterium]